MNSVFKFAARYLHWVSNLNKLTHLEKNHRAKELPLFQNHNTELDTWLAVLSKNLHVLKNHTNTQANQPLVDF